MAKSVKYTVNFLEAKEGDLHRYPSSFGHPRPLYLYPCTPHSHEPITPWVLMASCCPPSYPSYSPHKSGWASIASPCPLPYRIEIPFKFHMLHSGLVHGLAFWFDVAFIGSM